MFKPYERPATWITNIDANERVRAEKILTELGFDQIVWIEIDAFDVKGNLIPELNALHRVSENIEMSKFWARF